MNTNYAGLNGFIWWVGVVENRVDHRVQNRVKVDA